MKKFLTLTIILSLHIANSSETITSPLIINDLPSCDQSLFLSIFPHSTPQTVIGTKSVVSGPNKTSIMTLLLDKNLSYNDKEIKFTCTVDENNKVINFNNFESFNSFMSLKPVASELQRIVKTVNDN